MSRETWAFTLTLETEQGKQFVVPGEVVRGNNEKMTKETILIGLIEQVKRNVDVPFHVVDFSVTRIH